MVESASLRALLQVLAELQAWTKSIAPEEASSRFGNPAFSKYHARLKGEAEQLLEAVCDTHASELSQYLTVAFGNERRLDYGTGHELAFMVLLYGLRRANVVTRDDACAMALVVFPAYLDVARAVQCVYQLEPAGSRGVWGLDDYSFMPFILGSAQLLDSDIVQPTFVTDNTLIKENRGEYLYVDAIAYIKSLKTGPFHEHSPTLWDISGVSGGWMKINMGMLKMYKGEVLSKFPIMQHLLFGSLFPFPEIDHKTFRPPVRSKSGGPAATATLSSVE